MKDLNTVHYGSQKLKTPLDVVVNRRPSLWYGTDFIYDTNAFAHIVSSKCFLSREEPAPRVVVDINDASLVLEESDENSSTGPEIRFCIKPQSSKKIQAIHQFVV